MSKRSVIWSLFQKHSLIWWPTLPFKNFSSLHSTCMKFSDLKFWVQRFCHWEISEILLRVRGLDPCVPPLHIRCLTGSNITGHSQQVTQHHTACLWAPHSTTCWHWYSPSVHHTEPAARTIQIQAALLPSWHYSALFMEPVAAPSTSGAHTWRPHADCNLSRRSRSAWSCLPPAA